jgi:hypothetical protein
MPKLADMFPSKFLKASDIDVDYEVTIAEVAKDTVGQGDKEEEKHIVYFNEFDKGLVLNVTNGNLIAAQHGDDTDGWKGKKIVLTVEDVTFQGKVVPAIRVKRPARAQRPSAPAGGRTAPRPASEQEAAESGADEEAGNARKHGKF